MSGFRRLNRCAEMSTSGRVVRFSRGIEIEVREVEALVANVLHHLRAILRAELRHLAIPGSHCLLGVADQNSDLCVAIAGNAQLICEGVPEAVER